MNRTDLNPVRSISGISFVVVCVLSCIVVGCGRSGPERVALRGIVQLDEQPLKAGRIMFIPVEPLVGPLASGRIVDGVYEISDVEGAVVGTHRVEIKADLDLGIALDDDEAYAAREAAPLPRNPVPEKYNRRSTLSAETSSDGPNEFDFALASEKPVFQPSELENQ